MDGRLRVLEASDLSSGTYLPVARNIDLSDGREYHDLDLSASFLEEELVQSDTVHSQISLLQQNRTSVKMAAAESNITPTTMRWYGTNPVSVPDRQWARRKRDTSWFPRKIPLDERLGRVIGFYLSEGNTEKTMVRFTNLDEKIKDCLAEDLRNVFGKASVFERGVYICQSSLRDWFLTTFGTGAAEKNLPARFMAAPLPFRRALLSAYFSGDGWVEEKSASVNALTKSRELAYQISDLLSTIGIFSCVKNKILRTGPYKGRRYYCVVITGEELFEFNRQIEFISSAKKQRLQHLLTVLTARRRYQSRDIIPNFGKLCIQAAKDLQVRNVRGTPARGLMGETRGKTYRQRLGRKYLRQLLYRMKQMGSEGAHSKSLDSLSKLAESDIYWDKVARVERVDEETTVYDIGTENGHFILANGNLIVHNSQILKFVAGLASRGLYTSGKGTTAAGLCVAADSMVSLKSGYRPISEIIDEQTKDRKWIEHADGIHFSENNSCNLQVLHSENLQIKSGLIERFWRIKSPDETVHVRTRTGKELELTPQTSLLSIDERFGPVWKKADILAPRDRVATARELPIQNVQEIPSTLDLIRDYPNNLLLVGLKDEVSALVSGITTRLGITKRELAKRLRVCEDSIYRWSSQRGVGNISLRHFILLCSLLGEDVEAHLPGKLTVQASRGHSVTLPRRFDPELFYILGLVAGDGRITLDKRRPRGHETATIGLSNNSLALLGRFSRFFEELGLTVTYSAGSRERPPERRICSSVIYHIFRRFGLEHSPKASKISPNPELLRFPEEHLAMFVKGLFDAEGWFFTRRVGSSHIGFASTSKNLIDFVQRALATKGIVSFCRERNPSGGIKLGRAIRGKHQLYELSISNHVDILNFTKSFCFEDPLKRNELLSFCTIPKKLHKNLDNIPNVSTILWNLMTFYNTRVLEVDGRRTRITPSWFRSTISAETLHEILPQVDLDWKKHPVKIPFSLRNNLYKEIKEKASIDEVLVKIGMSQPQIYEYLMRDRGTPSIPIGFFVDLLAHTKPCLAEETLEYWTTLIDQVQAEHARQSNCCKMLGYMCDSKILWDEITNVERRQPRQKFVYDLTIPGTHNFIANGFVVHNTAAVIHDTDTGAMTLEAGALVLADQGVACIDEFDKMDPDDRTSIHEAMEQHTVSIAKAGIVATLNARTSILAAANPALGRYEPSLSMQDNIKLPFTILSRFDLIWILVDTIEPTKDRELAQFILNMHQRKKNPTKDAAPPIAPDFLKKYIGFANRYVIPQLTPEAAEVMEDFYVDLRKSAEGGAAPVPITARQLESLVRLAEARARMALRPKVTKEDAQAAVRLMQESLRMVAFDTVTGKIDIDRLVSKMSAAQRSSSDIILKAIKDMEAEGTPVVSEDALIQRVTSMGLSKERAEEVIRKLVAEGILFNPREGKIKRAQV
jgi:replicative DNA helicase Mcm